MFATKIHKYRNGSGVALTAKVLREAGLSGGDSVVVVVRDGVIEIRKSQSDEASALEGVELAMVRYAHALRELAK